MPRDDFDVTVIGGGMAGMAACVHLARAGLRVLCIEPGQRARQPVGESLDWSSPALLGALDLPMDDLMQSGISTYKRGVTMQLEDGPSRRYMPRPWLSRGPFHIELRTLHVDRVRLDHEIQHKALALGVEIVRDRAASVERNGMRIAAVQTAAGHRFTSPWFIDASGFHTSLLAREFALPVHAFGPRKVALWTYFTAPLSHEGTTIYVQAARETYMDWIWEIPIGPDTLSVGYIATGESIKQRREAGLTVEEILMRQLQRFPRLETLAKNGAKCPPHTTAFHCRTFEGVSGPNWIIIGEAASMADPITSNGVTSALRHAAEASALIVEFRGASELPHGARTLYNARVLSLGRFFNSGIEKLVYDWRLRDRVGVRRAATAYVGAAWSVNAVYSRWRPRGFLSTWLFGALLGVLRGAASVCYWLCGRK